MSRVRWDELDLGPENARRPSPARGRATDLLLIRSPLYLYLLSSSKLEVQDQPELTKVRTLCLAISVLPGLREC